MIALDSKTAHVMDNLGFGRDSLATPINLTTGRSGRSVKLASDTAIAIVIAR